MVWTSKVLCNVVWELMNNETRLLYHNDPPPKPVYNFEGVQKKKEGEKE